MFHICCKSFGDMENNMGGHGFILDLDFLDKWAPFHSKNGSCDLRCEWTPRSKGTKLLILW